MAAVTINGVTVNVAPGETVTSDEAGNITVSKSGARQGPASHQGLGRVVAEGAALGVGAGVGLGVGNAIVEGVSGLFD